MLNEQELQTEGEMVDDFLFGNSEEAVDEESDNSRDQKKEWNITNDSTADWALEKIANIKMKLDREKQIADEKIKQTEMWYKTRERQAENDINFFKMKLMDYFETLPQNLKTPSKKSKTILSQYNLPSGTLQFKIKSPELIKNDEELLAWVKDNSTTYLKLGVNWGEFKKTLEIRGTSVISKETGEVIDCVKIEEKAPEFEIKI